ncbi:hypothetical protein A2533_03875 [Candidatus Falkowbacteria bacterium RIFOXYD2_FULL_35_9]|uniref:Uncharacterized protein n=1 Tax=Candidatus Falkowbacteria bacterium RIFOXYC2_FULL_36_12 TaxID=1798002 RepID=A0A1F5T4C3_9BACT|nr:MAG: hypothetical protein A2300_01255 [Candidatus Falkowbacteria bacterium RIFOXYB2_FULL_35_7]OGF33311.1 MAG: hypothetical protein A2478_01235 [Candidatus Falkowbacteria bacterium RIFOXYC2_FULL_36_12]OGF34861.1 MAG: hypothetical protein A2223_00370 [Candidatus Falkowbacteria bacterium RIFOXYA2_FULL_35_8]OGF48567.1 MAG: hypothetical protein A2533_03875 [Candidatus Falkowbacteria bacterium RIFOXYD2_FULL_35_9]
MAMFQERFEPSEQEDPSLNIEKRLSFSAVSIETVEAYLDSVESEPQEKQIEEFKKILNAIKINQSRWIEPVLNLEYFEIQIKPEYKKLRIEYNQLKTDLEDVEIETDRKEDREKLFEAFKNDWDKFRRQYVNAKFMPHLATSLEKVEQGRESELLNKTLEMIKDDIVRMANDYFEAVKPILLSGIMSEDPIEKHQAEIYKKTKFEFEKLIKLADKAIKTSDDKEKKVWYNELIDKWNIFQDEHMVYEKQ